MGVQIDYDVKEEEKQYHISVEGREGGREGGWVWVK